MSAAQAHALKRACAYTRILSIKIVRGLMDKKSEQCKDVYAHFGLALYLAQCLEQGMIHLIVFLDHFPKAVASFTTRENWEDDYDKFFEGENKRTMGQLLGRLQKVGIPCDKLKIKLKEALVKRNWLAHAYFSERAMEFMSEAGRLKMISELELAQQLFSEIDTDISSIFYEIADKHGLSEEIINKMMEEMFVEAKYDL